MNGQSGMTWSKHVGAFVFSAVRGTLVRPEGCDPIRDAIEPAKDAFKVVVRHLLGVQPQVTRYLWIERAEYLLVRHRDPVGREINLTYAFKDGARRGQRGRRIGRHLLVSPLVFDLDGRDTLRFDLVYQLSRRAGKRRSEYVSSPSVT